jgi:hypothetical protein
MQLHQAQLPARVRPPPCAVLRSPLEQDAGEEGRESTQGGEFKVSTKNKECGQRGDQYPGTNFDLVACFDCLHEMGDPLGAARHVLASLDPEGTWLILEPFAANRVEDNLNPTGRAYYAASTLFCTPASLAQPLGAAQAGDTRLREIVTAAGFSRFRCAAETAFNLVLEARPLDCGLSLFSWIVG